MHCTLRSVYIQCSAVSVAVLLACCCAESTSFTDQSALPSVKYTVSLCSLAFSRQVCVHGGYARPCDRVLSAAGIYKSISLLKPAGCAIIPHARPNHSWLVSVPAAQVSKSILILIRCPAPGHDTYSDATSRGVESLNNL